MTGEKGCLTRTDREFLRGEKEYESKQARYARRKSIRDGARGALRDFSLLVEELPAEEREKIFEAIDDPRSDEYRDLREDVRQTIEFIYAGMGGASEFRMPLLLGVMNGEVELGEAQRAIDVSPQFSVDRKYQADTRETVDLVEAKEWKRLLPPDLFTFLRAAYASDAIDFDAIRDWLDQQEWTAEYRVGKKTRGIPGGKSTPAMDPEVFEREGIGDMDGDELHELFGEGYAVHSQVYYDGEKVLRPPPMGSDEEPEVVEWIHGEPDDETES